MSSKACISLVRKRACAVATLVDRQPSDCLHLWNDFKISKVS